MEFIILISVPSTKKMFTKIIKIYTELIFRELYTCIVCEKFHFYFIFFLLFNIIKKIIEMLTILKVNLV